MCELKSALVFVFFKLQPGFAFKEFMYDKKKVGQYSKNTIKNPCENEYKGSAVISLMKIL